MASTVPAHAADAVPRFVLDQALSLAAADADVTVRILAPHSPESRGLDWPRSESADGRVAQHRFRYAPTRLEVLTARGIMPAIAEQKALVGVVPLLIAGERRALLREVRRQRPDVIYAHWFTPQAIVAADVSRRTGVPFMFTTHAADVAVLRRLGPLGTRIVRRVTRRAAQVTAVSRQTSAKLLAFFEGSERRDLGQAIAMTPMGIDADGAQPADAPVPNPHTVAVIARLVEKKGVHVLLEAWQTVRAAVPDARLLIGGDGPWRDRLEDQAADLEGVEFRGYVSGDAKKALESQAAVVAVPSVIGADGDADGLPVSAIEALGRGAYLVASDASGAHELLEASEAGAVVPAGNADALAAALVEAMTLDDAARERAGSIARELGESLTWEALAPVMLDRLRAAARMGGWRA